MARIKRAKWRIIIFTIAFLVFPLLATAKDVPHGIAGIVLGTNVKDYPELTQNNYLEEVVVTDWHGFRKGTISYGTCKYVDQILKIDMKYQDKSKEFYQKLLKQFREEFEETGTWNGDSFGVMYLWKWQFTDKKGDRISLTLQYNGKNSDETIGNIVKISYPEKIEEERCCFADACQQMHNNIDANRREELNTSDWTHLVPR